MKAASSGARDQVERRNRLMVIDSVDQRYRQLLNILRQERLVEQGGYVLDCCYALDEALEQLSARSYQACFIDEQVCRAMNGDVAACARALSRRLERRFVTTPLVFMLDSERVAIGPEEARLIESGRIRILPARSLSWTDVQGAIADLVLPHVRVLIVHPDADAAVAIADVLRASEDHHYQVEYANGLDPAIDALRGGCFELLIVNHNLGNEAGSELLSLLEIQNAALPAILCTGGSEIELDELALRMVGRRQAQLISFRRALRQPGALERLCAAQLRRH